MTADETPLEEIQLGSNALYRTYAVDLRDRIRPNPSPLTDPQREAIREIDEALGVDPGRDLGET